MDKIVSPSKTKAIVEKYKFRFSKSLGQNFLIDQNILEDIVDGADIQPDDCVIEIGPGIGTLTQFIAEKAHKVVAIEIDRNLIPILKHTLADYQNVEVINQDVLKVDLHQLIADKFEGKPVKVIANLPYYVTTPIVMRFLEEKVPVDSLVIMIQKEVAVRMQAGPGTKDYGALSIAVQYYCNPEILLKVPPSVFIPQPKVESIVIKLQVYPEPKVKVERDDLMFALVKDAFGKRRKTLLNALSSGLLQLSKEIVRESLEAANIDENRRGETLTIEEYATLTKEVAARQ
ncbi:dimethyladenosine transferase [Alkaliphilus metalliredigens QYMF]|uniref:Ribosomal RNA small subunit methyltransferase A n=1 Tax=Alkaliphilus metalliredigens (strain QYMF) TaxID=293826 RepID=RSMA_ALKMQ|nr:16S rRNA (adenine(1518)-N(6)/adenine(1519)-N(6))-dimethyltransferase RsmA [Alkaliphilus metalliredigens]A6TJK9.1 RecName: Full=Ribosomal RNA small subunit methyltransferase A; AltName: Full=16S rRNA (adenine(1518)-N(6)/adenine(1519)-N(6))-dimethyltransferase; AltName: Full=16S rRNA dimethyladenosine transferase; AltName: Full=16S rRNA dimethylase; AltName: Full=S-adenosylmethionine-6-N', N'-adenosyl(rRNA) dimethyltransferase [Alkaliphilus metalliredigens QYMF]ABR46377.1 dimethyladenosine trans